LLGLEFLIAADIIDTLMKPSTQDLVVLGAIVAIRHRYQLFTQFRIGPRTATQPTLNMIAASF